MRGRHPLLMSMPLPHHRHHHHHHHHHNHDDDQDDDHYDDRQRPTTTDDHCNHQQEARTFLQPASNRFNNAIMYVLYLALGKNCFLLSGLFGYLGFSGWRVFFSCLDGDGSSLTYRSTWLSFKGPNNKKDRKKNVPVALICIDHVQI